MKKILTLLGTITLIGTSTTSLVACNKPDNNGNDKKQKIMQYYNPQPPLENSSWKLINIHGSDWIQNKEFSNNKNKLYIMFAKKQYTDDFNFIKFKNNEINNASSLGYQGSYNISLKGEWYWFNWLYRWDGDGLPEEPVIDKNTSEITDWNEKRN